MSSQGIFSQEWQRVSDLTPKLRRHLRLHRLVYRDQVWYVAEDESNGSHQRLNESAYEFARYLNGENTVNTIWHELLERQGNNAPDQHEVIQLLGELHQADMIRASLEPDAEELFSRHQKQQRNSTWGRVNPLAFKAPLFNPGKLLDRIQPGFDWLFNWYIGLLWVGIAITALLAGIRNWEDITTHAAMHLPTARYWMLIWIVYPALKFCHELGHALAVRHWGGKVHEMGITLLVLMPVPYVDASAANLFPDRFARVMVSAAGIMVEVFFSALALLIWLNVGDGVVRDIAFVTMTIGGLSTVLFNGNPLVKFDGYHVLADWLEIPNLARRSGQYWGWLARRFGLRLSDTEPLHLSKGETKWLLGYAPASWIYRWFILIAIFSWLSTLSLILALGASAMFLYSLLVKPAFNILRFLSRSGELSRHRFRTWTGVATLSTLLVTSVAAIPLPYATISQGVVWLPNEAMVLAGSSGFVDTILVTDKQRVVADQPLFTLRDEQLMMKARQLKATQDALKTRHRAAQQTDPAEAFSLQEELNRNYAELGRVNNLISQLTVRSRSEGTIIIPELNRLQDRFVTKGSSLGYVLGSRHATRLRTAIPQADASKLNDSAQQVSIQFSDSRGDIVPGEIIHTQPSGTTTLPSAALSYSAGGDIVTDPSDEAGVTTLEPVVVVDVALSGHRADYIGNRAWVRFDHGRKPLLQQWMLRWEQLFLQHFSGEA